MAASSIKPRTHSVRGISRAKIKTIKLTVVVIAGYILCSTPFICVQLYSVYGNPSKVISKISGRIKDAAFKLCTFCLIRLIELYQKLSVC